MALANPEYPLRLEVDYPERLDRLSTAFRIFWLIPILIVLLTVSNQGDRFASGVDGDTAWLGLASAGGALFAGPLLMILFRQKYPKWWFDWNLEVTRFTSRVIASLALLSDLYPSTDDQQSVHLDIDYPDVENDLNRWLPLVKWLLAIPHYIVLFFLGIAAVLMVVGAWFAILFTGSYPRGLFDFVVGVGRWSERVGAYAFLLVTDRYPPFSLNP